MAEKRSKIVFALETSYLILIFSLGFMQPSVFFRGVSIQITDLLFLAVSFLLGLAILTRQIAVKLDKFLIPLFLYLTALAVSTIFSENSSISSVKFVGSIYLVGLAVISINVVRDSRFLRLVVIAWLSASIVSSMICVAAIIAFYLGQGAIMQFALDGYGTLNPGNFPRLQGTFEYPSMLCNYLSVSLLLLFAAYREKWIGKSASVAIASVFAISLAFTFTPGLGGACLAVGVLVFLVLRQKEDSRFAVPVLGIGILAYGLFLFVSAIAVIGISPEPQLNIFGFAVPPAARLLTWRDSLQTFLTHPLFGKGLGMPVANVFFTTPTGENHLLTDAHNTFLSVASQGGIFAIATLLVICFFILRRRNRSTGLSTEVCLMVAFGCAFLAQGMVGSFEDARHLWVLIGLIFAARDVKSLAGGV